MKKNLGMADRMIRILLALGFGYLGYYYNPGWYILSVFLTITAFIGFCWPYTWFGIDTTAKAVKKKRRK